MERKVKAVLVNIPISQDGAIAPFDFNPGIAMLEIPPVGNVEDPAVGILLMPTP
jgi:hypothetical protein